jgi:1-acyl-sn-glycerol-3-phosphate acyltransferase
MRLFYCAAKPVVGILLSILCRRQVKRHQENTFLDDPAPLIIISNHLSWVDPLFLALSIHRRIAFMAKEELFRSPFWRPLLHGLGSFPVRRGQIDRKALRKASELLSQGLVLGIFPEGRRNPDAQLQPAHLGTAFIALHTDAFILPVGITGTEKIKERVKSVNALLRRPQVVVNIGEPFKLPPVNGKLTHAQLALFTDFIMRRVAELLPESYRGVYGKDED